MPIPVLYFNNTVRMKTLAFLIGRNIIQGKEIDGTDAFHMIDLFCGLLINMTANQLCKAFLFEVMYALLSDQPVKHQSRRFGNWIEQILIENQCRRQPGCHF